MNEVRRAKNVILFILVLVAVDCHGGAVEVRTMNPKQVVRRDDCELTVTVHLTDGKDLSLSYSFLNGTQQDVYLFNRLYSRFDTERRMYLTERNLVYVELREQEIVLSKKVFPVPEDIDVEKPVVPLATRVRPKEHLEETLTILLPIRLTTPYSQKETLQTAVVARPASFEMGFFLSAGAKTEQLSKIVPTRDGPAIYFYPFSQESQRILKTEPLIEIPIELTR
jgi:hypothetical protein